MSGYGSRGGAGGGDWEALVASACAVGVAAGIALGMAMGLARPAPEPAPVSICEFCGQVLDGTNNVCVPEGWASRTNALTHE